MKDQLRPDRRGPRDRRAHRRDALGARARRGTGAAARARRRGGSGPLVAPPPRRLGRSSRSARSSARVYDFVVSQTRYVGLEFGIHGYKPYRVDQVLARRFGDCKDKASLIHAHARRRRDRLRGSCSCACAASGAIAEAPASLAVFNHAIVYVPEPRPLARRHRRVLRLGRAARRGPRRDRARREPRRPAALRDHPARRGRRTTGSRAGSR